MSNYSRNGVSPWMVQNSINNRTRMDLIELFDALAHRFTEWEANFAKSLKEQHVKGGIGCTGKQAIIAERIIKQIYSRIER